MTWGGAGVAEGRGRFGAGGVQVWIMDPIWALNPYGC